MSRRFWADVLDALARTSTHYTDAPYQEALIRGLNKAAELYADGEISVSAYGALRIALGDPRLTAHPDCDMQTGWPDSDHAPTWKDASGREWKLTHHHVYTDRDGNGWRWSGGFRADPDTQPLMSRTDYSVQDVPLCRLWAAVGPLEASQ